VGLNRQEKAAKVEEVSALVAAAQTIVVAEYRGLDVESVTKLRKNARSQGVQLRVLKNTLARRAVDGTPFSGLSDNFVMDEKGVKALATMPSREELLAKLMATMQAPIAQFVRTLNEVPSRLVRTLAAVRDAKEGATA
jgi:large subunit ribosomal protein L10